MSGQQAPSSVKFVHTGDDEVSELMLNDGEEQDRKPISAVHCPSPLNLTKVLLGNDRIIRIERLHER